MNKRGLMTRLALFLFLLALTVTLACGRAHVQILKPPMNISTYQNIYVADAEVSSREQTENANAMNEKWAVFAKEEIIRVLENNEKYNIFQDSSATSGSLILETEVNIVYGSRALRYWIGFGAGAGHCTIHMKLKDSSSGELNYELRSEADLGFGAFGGSMDKVIEDSIKEAVRQFVNGM